MLQQPSTKTKGGIFMLKKRVVWIVFLAFMSAGFSAGGIGPAGALASEASITRGGNCNAAQAAKWSSLDPTVSSGRANDKFTINQLYETLIDVDSSGKYIPGLAEAWEVKGDKTIILKLKKNVKFHDGTDFNAQAVKFVLERALNPETKASFRAEIEDIQSIEVVDPTTVKLTLKNPSSVILGALSNYAGYMISPAAIQKYGKDIVRNPVGTGPFKFKEAVEGDHITLVRNESYHIMGKDGKGLPYLDELSIKIIPDDSVKLVNLKSGGLDLIDSVQTINIQGLKASKDLVLVPTSASRLFKLLLNVTKEPLSKKEVRQAIAFAVDREEFARVVASGYGTVEPSVVMKQQWFYSPTAKYSYDIQKAKKLLAQAGYPNGFKVKLSFTSREPDKTIIQLVQSQLKKIGIDGEIETYDRLAFNDKWNKREGQIGLNFLPGPKPDPYMQFQIFFATKGNNNFTGYSSRVFDETLEKSKETYDIEKRKALYKELQNILAEDSPEVFLFHLPLFEAHTKKLQGFRTDPEGGWILREAWMQK
jgi:peptide/nickel transport system substrate-binding protein